MVVAHPAPVGKIPASQPGTRVGETETSRGHRKRGFERAGQLVQGRIRKAGESRGFAVAKVLTHWAEIAGPELAAKALPVKVSYPAKTIGATLTLLTTGAEAPFVEMQKESLRARVNACYGYNAVTRIRLTQTAPTGFSEGRVSFAPRPEAPRTEPPPLPAARAAVADIRDPGLRDALERMGRSILAAPKHEEN